MKGYVDVYALPQLITKKACYLFLLLAFLVSCVSQKQPIDLNSSRQSEIQDRVRESKKSSTAGTVGKTLGVTAVGGAIAVGTGYGLYRLHKRQPCITAVSNKFADFSSLARYEREQIIKYCMEIGRVEKSSTLKQLQNEAFYYMMYPGYLREALLYSDLDFVKMEANFFSYTRGKKFYLTKEKNFNFVEEKSFIFKNPGDAHFSDGTPVGLYGLIRLYADHPEKFPDTDPDWRSLQRQAADPSLLTVWDKTLKAVLEPEKKYNNKGINEWLNNVQMSVWQNDAQQLLKPGMTQEEITNNLLSFWEWLKKKNRVLPLSVYEAHKERYVCKHNDFTRIILARYIEQKAKKLGLSHIAVPKKYVFLSGANPVQLRAHFNKNGLTVEIKGKLPSSSSPLVCAEKIIEEEPIGSVGEMVKEFAQIVVETRFIDLIGKNFIFNQLNKKLTFIDTERNSFSYPLISPVTKNTFLSDVYDARLVYKRYIKEFREAFTQKAIDLINIWKNYKQEPLNEQETKWLQDGVSVSVDLPLS